jgi:lipid A disaccharide synthetase
MYQTNRVIWSLIGWWLIRPKFFTLVNLLADRPLVREFMPYFTSIEPILSTVDGYLQDRTLLTRTSNELIDVVEPLTQKKAGEAVAVVVTEMLE